jgi:hypothetical protein
MPDREASALTADALFQAAVIPSRTTGQHALRDLLAAGAIQRVGLEREATRSAISNGL